MFYGYARHCRFLISKKRNNNRNHNNLDFIEDKS
jgi:hypothetical protein